MKKKAFALLCAIFILALFPAASYADVGPKPSVVVDFKGLEGERYYATLLSSDPSTGPFSAIEGDAQTQGNYHKGDTDYEVFLKFAQYEGAPGFYFLQNFADCSQTHRFSWTYFPPQEFKILLYFPQADRFVISGEAYRRYAFDSYFTADASGLNLAGSIGEAGGLRVRESYHYGWEALSLAVRIALTIAVELAVALLFGLREKRQLRFIMLVNIITQVALNVLLNMIHYHMGMLAFALSYILLEFVVFLAEGILYAVNLKKRGEKEVPGWKPWVYAFAANTASFILGAVLATLSFTLFF